MVSFTTVHRWNSLLCPPLGFLFNFALLWLILRRTPKEMRVHSRILLQTCAMDWLLLASQCFGQITFTFDRKTSCFVQFFDGYVVSQFKTHMTPLMLLSLHFVWAVLHHFSVLGISVQFFYRYMVLNRNINITLSKYLLLSFGTALWVFVMATLILLGQIEGLNQQPIDRQRFGAFVDFDLQPLFVTEEFDEGSHLKLVVFACCMILMLHYAIICFCGWKMVRFVTKNATLGGRLKELNNQLTKCMIIMACIPLFIASANILIIADYLVGRSAIQPGSADWTLEWELYLVLTMHWLPVLNPLAAIYVNRPYRDALIARFVKISPITNG